MTLAPLKEPTRMTSAAVDSGDLWKWVDRLTRDRRQRLVRQTPGTSKVTVEYVPVPSLWTQLLEALASSNGSDGRPGKNTGSRSPLDLAIEALLTDMSTDVRRGLIQHGAQPRYLKAAPLTAPARPAPPLVDVLVDEDGQPHRLPLVDPDTAGRILEHAARAGVTRDTGRYRHDVHTDLRQLAAVIVGTRQQPLIDLWARRYQTWVARAETILTGDQENIDLRGIRGHACPTCGAAWVERCEPSTDPRATDGVERYRDPALVIAFRDGQVQHITCRACDTGWWRGDDVDHLAADIRTTPPASAPARDRQPIDYGDDVNHGGLLEGRSDDWWPWPEPRGGSAA